MPTPPRHWVLVAAYFMLGVVNGSRAEAQFLRKAWNTIDQIPDPTRLGFDLLEVRRHERRLQHDQTRLQQDLSQGDTVRVQQDLNRMRFDQHAVDRYQWELQRDSLHNPGPYSYHPESVGSVATLVAHPAYPGIGSSSADPTRINSLPAIPPVQLQSPTKVPVTVVLAGTGGNGPAFVVNGSRYESTPGQPHKIDVVAGSEIEYDRGGTFGKQRYSLSAGAYEFRPSSAGWALYKLP